MAALFLIDFYLLEIFRSNDEFLRFEQSEVNWVKVDVTFTIKDCEEELPFLLKDGYVSCRRWRDLEKFDNRMVNLIVDAIELFVSFVLLVHVDAERRRWRCLDWQLTRNRRWNRVHRRSISCQRSRRGQRQS